MLFQLNWQQGSGFSAGDRTLARLFVALGGLIVLALTFALAAPYFIDWSSYRADFEREASRILGRDVKVEGDASARLLPFPSVTFTDVTVAGSVADEPAMTVETFSMDAELAPFMRGEFLIFDMRLVRPAVLVDVGEDGSIDWAMRPSVPIGASNISLEKLTVTEGRLALRHAASGRTHQLTEINAGISARALTGPWRIDGSMRIDGMLTDMQVSTGSYDGDGMRLRVQAAPERYPVALEADGHARIADGRMRYEGEFKLNATSLAERAPGRPDSQEPPAVAPYRLAGSFDIDHTAIAIDEFRFQTGSPEDPYTADGSASFDLGTEPRFSIRADGAQVRFGGEEGEGQSGISFEARMAALRDFLLDMPRPSIPGEIEVALPAIVAGDTTIRDVSLSTRPVDGGWAIDAFSAVLPGRATLEADGRLAVGEELGFDGDLLLAIGQPSGFAAWLSKDVDDAIRRLPAAGFNATVSLGRERQSLDDLELVLGAARFRGAVESLTPDGQRPSMMLSLDGDSLDVEGMAAFASLFVSDGGETRLSNRDLEFDITAGPVTVAGMSAETLDTALRLKQGQLEIDRLSIGGFGGANISATGSIKNFDSAPAGNLDAAIISPDLGQMIDMVAQQFPDNAIAAEAARRLQLYPGLLDDGNIQLVLSSVVDGNGDSGLAISANGEAGGTRFDLTASSPNASLSAASSEVSLQLTARNDDAAALYALFGVPSLPLTMAGSAETEFAFDGVPRSGGATRFRFAGEGLEFVFEGETGLPEDGMTANGKVTLDSSDIEPWLVTGGVVLPGMGVGLPVEGSAQLDIGSGVLVLSDLGGRVADAKVTGDLNAQLRDGLPHLTGSLQLGRFDLAAIAELAVGNAALQPGDGDWPTAPFSAVANAPVSTDIEIVVDELLAGSFARATNARFGLRVGSSGFAISDLQASAFGGTIEGLAELRNDAGTGFLSGQFSLSGADLRSLAGDTGITGRAELSATVTASGKSVDGLIASLGGSGTAGVDGVAIAGVDPGAFNEILRQADRLGPEIDATAVAAFAPDLVRRASFRAGSADVAFTIANGTVRTPPVVLDGGQAAMRADLRFDLGQSAVEAEALLTYDAGAEALAGSEPAVRLVAAGALGDVGVLVDTEPLAQFLTQRALELEQQRVEAMQAALIEKQRHRREVRYYAALDERRRRAAEESNRLERELEMQREEEARRAAEDEAARAADEEETRRQEAERQRAADEERQTAREAEQERQRREAEERLRREVEELLRSRDESLAPGGPDAVEREPLAPVATVPTPQPRAEPAAPRQTREQPRQPAVSDVFSEQNMSIEGLMRAIGE